MQHVVHVDGARKQAVHDGRRYNVVEVDSGAGDSSTMSSLTELKHQVITWLLQHEDFVLVIVDPQVPGVVIPDDLLKLRQPVGLHIGWRLTLPIPDLSINEESISGTLSFNRQPHFCVLPWAAIRQVTVKDDHLLWIETSPQPAELEGLEGERALAQPAKPKLRLV
jgi:hypothetical protein